MTNRNGRFVDMQRLTAPSVLNGHHNLTVNVHASQCTFSPLHIQSLSEVRIVRLLRYRGGSVTCGCS